MSTIDLDKCCATCRHFQPVTEVVKTRFGYRTFATTHGFCSGRQDGPFKPKSSQLNCTERKTPNGPHLYSPRLSHRFAQIIDLLVPERVSS